VLSGKYLLRGAVSTGRQVYSKKYGRCDVVLELGKGEGKKWDGDRDGLWDQTQRVPDELQGDLQLKVGFTGAVLWHRPQSWATTG
jgi:hypothetical protein